MRRFILWAAVAAAGWGTAGCSRSLPAGTEAMAYDPRRPSVVLLDASGRWVATVDAGTKLRVIGGDGGNFYRVLVLEGEYARTVGRISREDLRPIR
jgi:hypothetical protein